MSERKQSATHSAKRMKLRPSRTRSERRTAQRNLLRKTLSMLLLLLCWFPMLGGGIQALWVIPAAICIGMNEDMYFCMAAGTIAGFGIDISCGDPLGVNAIYMVICTSFVCLLFEELLRRSFLHYLILTAATVFLRSGLVILLRGILGSSTDRALLWHNILLPSSIRTILAAVVVYICFLPCEKILTKRVKSMDAAAIQRD